jgi:hypothetical protein
MGTFGFCVVGRKWETLAEFAAALLIFPHFPSFCIWVSHFFWKCMLLECDVCVMIYSKMRPLCTYLQAQWAADIKSSESQWSGWGVRGALQHNHDVEGDELDSFFSDAQQVMIALILVMLLSKSCCRCNFLFPRYLFAFEFTSKHNINL